MTENHWRQQVVELREVQQQAIGRTKENFERSRLGTPNTATSMFEAQAVAMRLAHKINETENAIEALYVENAPSERHRLTGNVLYKATAKLGAQIVIETRDGTVTNIIELL